MKAIITIACFMAAFDCFGQSFISPVVSIASPKDILSNGSDPGFAIGLKYHRKVHERIELSGTLEFVSFGKKVLNSNSSSKINMVRFQLGVLWFVNSDPSNRLYISGQAGFHHITTDAILSGFKANVNDETKFSYSPGLGVRHRQFDLAYRMQWVGTSQTIRYFTFSIAYIIPLKGN